MTRVCIELLGQLTAALCAALCAAMCAHNCERHCELCGNVAWFGMVGRKRLYERKEVMV